MPPSVLTNTAIASTGRILNAALGLVIVGIFARLQGQAWMGAYSLVFSYGVILQMAADLGLYLVLTQRIAREPENEHQIISHVVSLRLALCLLLFVTGFIFLSFLPEIGKLKAAYVLVSVGLTFQSISQLYMGIYQKYGKMWPVASGDIAGRILQLVCVVLVAQTTISIAQAIAIFVISASITTIVHFWYLPVRHTLTLAVNWQIWRQILTSSWPLGLLLLLNAVYFRIDTIILSFFRPVTEVGLYGVAYRVMESGLFFPAMFGGLLLPRLSQALATNAQLARRWLEEALSAVTVAAGLLLAVPLIEAERLIEIVAGAEFIPAGSLFRILILALLVMCFGNVFGFTLVALGKQKTMIALAALLIVVNIGINSMFIPHYGAAAAAWTTVATEVLATCIAGFFVFQALRYRVNWQVTARIAAITIIVALTMTLLPARWPILFNISVGVGMYAASLIITRTLHPKYFGLLLSRSYG